MRGLWLVGVFSTIVAAVVGISGCGPSVSREELGEVVFELPKVPPVETAPATNPPAESEKPSAPQE